MQALLRKIRQILKDRRIRRFFTRVVSSVAAIVVFITTYALILPAITLEKTAACGVEEHQHNDSCYEDRLVCGQEESDGHHHDDSCYSISSELICRIQEHQHSAENGCYDADGNLVCQLQEHVHDDSCYKEVRTLTCGLEESEGHHHTDACYKKVLICGKEVHTHSAACYQDTGENSDQESESGNAANPAASENPGADSAASENNTSELTDSDNAATAETVLPGQEVTTPELAPLDFTTILNKDTGVYYYSVKPEEKIEDSSKITDWTRAKDKNDNADDFTELAPEDLIRVYLAYTVPAGSLNTTNPTARYRLPDSIRLSDKQIEAINKAENGISSQYDDKDKHDAALGAEAIEGTRRPDQDIDEYLRKNSEDGQEYINATVKAENVFNDKTGEYEGQDLIFTFTPYTIEKNQVVYDTSGEMTKSGENVRGWFTFDMTTDQVEWGEAVVSSIKTGEETEGESEEAEDIETENVEVDNTAEQADEGTGAEAEENPDKEKTTDVQETAEDTEQEKTSAEETTTSGNKGSSSVIERSERSADIVFVKEGYDVDNNRIEEIATTLKLVEEKEVENSLEDDSDSSNDDTASDFAAGTLEASGEGYKITMEYTAEAQVPENASLSVREITAETDPEAYKECLEQAGKKMASEDSDDANDKRAAIDETASRFFDIEIVVPEIDENGQETSRKIEPKAEVSVNIQMTDTVKKASDNSAQNTKENDKASGSENQGAQEPTVLHFTDDGVEKLQSTVVDDKNSTSGDQAEDREKKDSETAEDTDSAGSKNGSTEIQFTTDSFSIYGVVYTVDFHWEVDGKVYEISIPGGGFLSFEKLVEILEIAKTDKEAESGNNQRAKSESDAAEETENSDEMAENNEASESTEDIEPDKETENTDKTVSASDDSQINEISDELSKKDIFLLALKDVRVSEETKEFVAKVDHIEFSNPELLWVDKVEKECTVSELKENNNLEVQYSDELTEEQIDEINAQTVETGDWALISLQQFYTEETLTVTMTNGKTWTIRVTDAVAEDPVRNPGTVNTVDTYADGVKMWLFNYDTDGNLDDSSNKIKFNGTDHTGKVGFNNNTLASDGINGYSGLKFLGWGSDSDYNITSNVDINNFTGLDESGQGKGNKIKALQGIVQNSLDENGYPVLNSQYSSTSLDYLFDPTANTNDRVVYGGENGNVTNLFRKENGYYKFDSNQHYAQFDGDHTFTVYDTTIPQTDKNGNKHNPTRAVGFFPFNSYDNMLGIWDTNRNQNGSHTLYLNPDRDTSKTDRAGVKDLDHHFGVMLEAKFVLPADGKDESGNPIRFDFSGDDDMWVFIDDELVLDIGGIHQPVSGTIDFQNGKAYVVGDHTVAGHSDNTGTNAVATAYGAGVTRNSTGDGNYYFYNDDSVGKKIQLGDGKVHTMKIFYIERGGCDSNCEITFNLPTVKTGNLDLKKVWGDVERRAEEVYYTITANYKEASDANKRDLAKFFSSMTEKQLTQYGLTKDNIKQIDANNDGVLDTNDPYVFVVKGSDWELKIKQLRICQDSLQNGNLTHDQIPLTYTVLERYALVDGKIVDATDQYSQAVEKSGAQLPSTSDIILGENDVSLWQDITGNNATFKVTNEPGMNVTVNKDWAQDCDPLSDTTITGVVKRYKLVDKGNTLTIQSVLEDTDNSGIDFSGVTYTIMKNGQQVGDPISFAEAQAGKNLELPDSGPYTVVENNVPGTPQGYSVVHNPQNQQHNVTLDPNGNTTVTFTTTYKQVNKPSNSTYLIRDYYYYNYQGGKDLNSGNIEFPVGARVTMKFKCRNGYWSSRDMKAEYNGERINITASPKDYNQNLEFTVGPFTVVENGRLVVDVNTNGNSNNDGFVSGSVNFTQVRSLHSNLRAMRMPLKAAPQKTDLTFSQELNETTLASLPAAPEGKHYVLDNWSKEVNLDAASDWTKTVAVEVGNNYGDYYYFLASVTEHNVTQDTQGTIATNNDGSIRFAHKHADSNLPFEIENKRAKGALKITKNVTYNNGTIGDIPEGKESLVDKEFKFTVTKDGTQIEGSPFSITITNGASQILTIPDLEMGNYVITETDSKGLELTAYTGGISQDSTTKSVTVTVTARDNTAAQPTAQAFFTNNYSETDIIVKKVDQDKAAANPEDAERFIAGAKFSLLDGDERAVTGYKVINLKTNQEVVLEDNKFVVPLEGVKITGLLNGSYVLKEQEAPAGYIITNNTTAFTVADGQVTAGGNGLTFEIPNPPGAALPNTGGPGTNKIYLLGIMLSGIAGAGLVMRKRRRAA